MKRIEIIIALLIAVLALGANSCEKEKTVDNPDMRDGVVCPKNPAGVPQNYGVMITVIGFVCVELNGETTCDEYRQPLDEISSPLPGCFAFQDGEQSALEIRIDGFCFVEDVTPSANLIEKNPFDTPITLDPDIECWEAEDRWYYPVCSQFLPGNDPNVIAVDACCLACGGAYTCCNNCEMAILPPGADVEVLRLGDPASFQACCADYEVSTHQPDGACNSGGQIQ